ncbi:MAG: hypothetical protein JWN52_5798 [Actinomycetia bacterium]|nr:hypothetical protein [Actinomycetes bacterium]
MAWFDVTFGPTATSTVHRSVWRWVLSGAAAASAVAHVPVIEPHLTEAPYMGVLFVVFTAICLVISSAALVRDTTALYWGAAVICGLGILAYIATRSVAFPQLQDDVGNWTEPLGIVSVLAEALVVVAAVNGARSRTEKLAEIPCQGCTAEP